MSMEMGWLLFILAAIAVALFAIAFTLNAICGQLGVIAIMLTDNLHEEVRRIARIQTSAYLDKFEADYGLQKPRSERERR